MSRQTFRFRPQVEMLEGRMLPTSGYVSAPILQLPNDAAVLTNAIIPAANEAVQGVRHEFVGRRTGNGALISRGAGEISAAYGTIASDWQRIQSDLDRAENVQAVIYSFPALQRAEAGLSQLFASAY